MRVTAKRIVWAAASWLLVALVPATFIAAWADEPAPLVFENDILPILTAHCFKCHGFEARKANLDLRTVPLLMRGGEHGAVIVPGSSRESKLFQRVADRSMPPEKELPLTDAIVMHELAAGPVPL
jgi:hypothetical protein